jgi:hypothetical protein
MEWNHNHFLGLGGRPRPKVRLKEMWVQWLLDKGRWIRSPPVTTHRVEAEAVAKEAVEIPSARPAWTNWPDPQVVRARVAGRWFLYHAIGDPGPCVRICELEEGEKVACRLDFSGPQIEVRFPGSKRPPVYCLLDQGMTRDSPWPPGTTYEAFAPRPIPIPPDELRALRASAGLDAAGRPLAKPAMAPASNPGGRLPWTRVLALGAAAAAALGLVAVLLARRKRGPPHGPDAGC